LKPDQENALGWLFEPLSGAASKRDIWLWWEKRRLVYNLLLMLTGLISFTAYVFFLTHSGRLSQGEDIVEPIALIAAVTVGPILWNCAYCLGPILDIAALSENKRSISPDLLWLGMVLSVLLVSFPAIYWAIMCCHSASKLHS
jgi:hypothetical protein